MKIPPMYRIVGLALILLGLVVFYVYQDRFFPRVQVQIDRNVITRSNFDFLAEHWKEPKLTQLREQENYNGRTANTQFEYFLRLCVWTHEQWTRSDPDPYPLSNALDILADIRSGKTGGFCGQYAYVLADVLKSVGFFAVRYVELWAPTGQSHFVVEVWSDQYGKWIILDPDQNLYYALADGTPANAFEIRASLFAAQPVAAKNAETGESAIEEIPRAVYTNFAVSLRSDLLRHAAPLTVQDRFEMFLFYQDAQTTLQAFEQVISPGRIPYRHITTRKEDLYYDCNRVRIAATIDPDTPSVRLEFFTDQSMANFKAFSVSLDRGQTWKPAAYQYRITAEANEYEVWVRPVNMYNRPGGVTVAHIVF